jgi:branched-chain amino acid transport system substrate-binding protein
MDKYLKWSGILVAMLLVLAACQPAADDPSPPPDNGNGNGEDPSEACDADEFGCVEIAEGQPIRIGTSLVISGANADLGLDSQRGVEVAASLRGNELMGHPIEFDFQDDECAAEGGTASARALVSDPQIVAIIGTSCSSAGVPAAEISSEQGVLMVSPSNTAPSLTAEGTHQPFYARTAHNDEVQGAAMAEYACDELNAETAATIHDGSPYAEQLQQVFVEEFESQCGGETLVQEAISVGQADFTALLRSIAANPPDVLYYPIFTAEGALITQQASEESGLEDTVLAGADGMQSPSFLQAAGAAAEGMVLSGPDLEFEGEVYANEFIPAYEEIQGSAPISVFHAHAFDATNMVFQAIEEVALQGDDGTLYIPRTALRDAFFAISGFDGITGSLTCGETGDCADPSISVVEVRDGDFVRIWP